MSLVAVLNAGSSSIKFGVYKRASSPELILRGQVEGIGVSPRAKVFDAASKVLAEEAFEAGGFDHDAAVGAIMKITTRWLDGGDLTAVGHRIVHGGAHYSAPVVMTADVLAALTELIPLAPLHQPHNLAPIRAIRARRPELPQVACFDTAFHCSQAPIAQAFAIPRRYSEEGIRRYGFHGISYEYVASRLAEIAPEIADARLIVAHLGNGASLCAMQAGKSVASTMGFTAVDGIVMGTRCGSLDPGVMVHLMDRYGLDARGLEDLIYRESGLLGVSGVSSDMRELRASGAAAAKEAIDLFVYRIVREIGSLAAALGGLDGLVFTAGIGENDAATRAEVANGCRWLGLELDEKCNAEARFEIGAKSSRVRAVVVPTNEERMIALHAIALTSPTY
jgi:acetate kinase